MLEELLIYFYSFREYYRYAYRLLYLYEYNPEADVLGLINDLPLVFRKIFYYQKLDEQADVCPGMATAGSGDVLSGILVGLLGYFDYQLLTVAVGAYLAGLAGEIAEQEKTAKRVKMTSEEFMAERFIPKVAPILQRRNEDFMEANNVFIFDDDADIQAELKKLFKKPD